MFTNYFIMSFIHLASVNSVDSCDVGAKVSVGSRAGLLPQLGEEDFDFLLHLCHRLLLCHYSNFEFKLEVLRLKLWGFGVLGARSWPGNPSAP